VTMQTPPLPHKDADALADRSSSVPGHVQFERAWRERWTRTIDEITTKRKVSRKAAKETKRASDEFLGKIIAKWQTPERKR
jgi:hypothetical protein